MRAGLTRVGVQLAFAGFWLQSREKAGLRLSLRCYVSGAAAYVAAKECGLPVHSNTAVIGFSGAATSRARQNVLCCTTPIACPANVRAMTRVGFSVAVNAPVMQYTVVRDAAVAAIGAELARTGFEKDRSSPVMHYQAKQLSQAREHKGVFRGRWL